MSPREARYETLVKLASGGMATVWIGAAKGAFGFRQLVAIKRPHPHLFEDPDFRRELLAEARLASLIHHANVVDVRDVEVTDDTVALVMDYIEGASVGELLVAGARGLARITPGVAVRIALDALAGLHAAHELCDEAGRPLGLVHRDVSPQNILVGTDGVSRVTDFGVAKFSRRSGNSTSDGALKGKLAYMAPEYIKGQRIDRRFDVFAMGVVLWEMLTGRRLFRGEHEADTMQRVLNHAPESLEPSLADAGRALDPILAAALAKKPEERFQTALAMAKALESAAGRAGLLVSYTDVADVVRAAVGVDLEERRRTVRERFSVEPALPSSALDRFGAAPAPNTLPLTAAPPMTAPVPTTEPMPAPEFTAPQPRNIVTAVPSTAPSPVAAPPAAGSGASIPARTLGSAERPSAPRAVATAVSERDAFRDITADSVVSTPRGVPRSKGLPAALVVGGVFVLTVAVAGGGLAWRMNVAREGAVVPSVPPSPPSAAPSSAVGAAGATTASASAGASAAAAGPSASASSRVVGKAGQSAPTRSAGAPATTPIVKPSAAPSGPPKNPYE